MQAPPFVMKRADRLALGDIIIGQISPSGFQFEDITVVKLQLVGDDVVVNEGVLTTSRPNHLPVKEQRIITVERDLEVTLRQTVTIVVPFDFDESLIKDYDFDVEDFDVIKDEDHVVETHESFPWVVK